MSRFLLYIMICAPILVEAQTPDTTIIRQVDSLIKVSRTLTGKRDFQKALDLNFIAEKLALEKFGKESAAYGSVCFNHGRILYYKTDYEEAEKWYLESKVIREKALGKEHPDYALSLNNLGILYTDIGNYEKAEQYYLESKGIREKVLGKLHPDYIVSLNNLADLYQKMGKYDKAEPYLLEAKAGREKALGKDHPDYALSVNFLAICYRNLGSYDKAEQNYLEVLAIRKKVLGQEHPHYASSLNNLGLLYVEMGKYDKAEELYLESKTIREKVLGKESNDYAGSLSNLADLYSDIGNYKKAEPLYLESLAIKERISGKENSEYASILNNLAVLYRDMGNYEKAEALYLESKAVREKVLGKEHPHYAISLNNLADLYWKMNNYEKAEALHLESKAIQEKTLGKEHPTYAVTLNNLALLYEHNKNYEKAESFYLESKAIREKVLGKNHPSYATSLINLASLYAQMRNYSKAELFYLESKAILEKVLGKEHPYYSENLNGLAELYEMTNRNSESEVLLVESSAIDQNRLLKACTFLSEVELQKFVFLFKSNNQQISSYMLTHHKEGFSNSKSLLPSLIYNNSLFYKGFLLNEANKLNGLVMSTSESKSLYERLKDYYHLLASEYSKPVADRKGVSELEEKVNTTEKELARSVKGYTEANQQVKWNEVQAALKPGEAAIEFVSFTVNFPTPLDSTMYVALLLKQEDNQPQFIPLFEEKSIDSLLYSKVERKADYVNGLYTLANRGAIAIETPKRSLYEIIWKPLEKRLDGIKTIYFSPSGLLHRINLDAIPIDETTTLADKYQLIELNSTRHLVIPNLVKNISKLAVLYGGIQFEQDTNQQNNEALIASRSRGELSFTSIDSTIRGGTWNFLSGTEREVNSIEKIIQTAGLNCTIKKGYDATEESFKNIGTNNNPSPRILHIATHGYFFSDPRKKVGSSQLAVSSEEAVFKMSEHPMLRSGLIMAGGNAAWQGKQTVEGREDGVLTAYEISQMNLSNTELVVLSACETGLGDIQGNEGVYGLQRAFKIAGAKYLIMSLWQVPDKQTSLLMTTFYKKWLENKMTIPNAFHAAQKELRDLGLDPYQWAGFVLVE